MSWYEQHTETDEFDELLRAHADLYTAEERVHFHEEQAKKVWLDPGHTPTEREMAHTQLRLSREILAWHLKPKKDTPPAK